MAVAEPAENAAHVENAAENAARAENATENATENAEEERVEKDKFLSLSSNNLMTY